MLPLDPKYLQRLVESSPDIIIAVDDKGTIIYYNDGARQNLGFSPEETIGQPCTRIYPTIEEARAVKKAMRESATPGRVSNYETQFLNKEGKIIPISISGSLIYDDTGNAIGSIGFARDIRLMRQRDQLVTAGEIAVSLAHEINNPLESIINNLELVARCAEPHLSESEKVIENERLDSIRASIARVQAIVRRLDEMTRKGVYETRDYLAGKKMADLSPREEPRPARDSEPAAAPSVQSPLAGMSVLVLDDDLTVVRSLGDLLQSEGCIVHRATRPSSALGILRNVKVDVVISDVVMPGEMDGYDFLLRVKEEIPELPVILMTAFYYDKDHILKRARLRGLEGALFKKPINPAKLRQQLTQIRQKTMAGRTHAAAKPAAGR